MPDQKQLQARIIAALGELGGQARSDDDVVFEGKKFVLPEDIDYKDAILFLDKKRKQEELPTDYTRTFPYRPWDGAYATFQALKKHFGGVGHNSRTVQTFFGPVEAPPQLITVPTGVDTEEQVPWGNFEVPFLPDTRITVDQTRDPELGLIFQVTATGPRKFRYQIEGIFKLIEKELEESSIYRGKAIDGSTMPNFIDTSGVDRDKVVYSNEVLTQLQASVWSLLRYSDQHRKLGIPLKRAVLIEGPYGTGKTLAATLTAQEAEKHGWTFLYARPGRDDLTEVMQTARLYQPAVVFFEDMDVIASPDAGEDGVSQMLDMFDGITAKGTEIVGILTTNHADKIHKGMVRPGRLDAVIHIGALDAAGIEKMVKAVIPNELLDDHLDFAPITDAMAGFMPAFVKEAADRALRYGLARNGGTTSFKLDTEDFVNAAHGLRPQLELMEEAPEFAQRDQLSVTHEHIIAATVEEVVHNKLAEAGMVPARN